jgi:hypothetical protein
MTEETPLLGGTGRIPFTLRIGITGHRELEDPASLVPVINDAIRQIKELVAGSQGVVLTAVSALAEGSDRLVVELILAEPGSRLEVTLPLSEADYIKDFEDVDSKKQFKTLLKRASKRWRVPSAGSREEAYELAGRDVVDRSDAMIALWDGEPARGRGGTAAIVAYARECGVPLIWVKVCDNPTMIRELGTAKASMIREAVRKLQEFNLPVIPPRDFNLRVRMECDRLTPEVADDEHDPLYLCATNALKWLIPYFVRADILAVRLQRQFRALSTAMFAMAAAAVTVVAIQENILPMLNWIVAFEVILLLCLLVIPLINRRWQLHDRWISYRFLAERLRSVYFLALAGTGDRRSRSARLAYLSDSSEVWIERALAEVISGRPKIKTGLVGVTSLRGYLSKRWIGEQISYHEEAALLQRKWDVRLLRATAVLFGVTLVAAFVHMLGIGEHGTSRSAWAVGLIVLSLSVPAIGAAGHGISTQRQFRRHAQRYTRMVGLLTQLQEQMDQSASREQVKKIAAEAERVMREENSDWFGVMRFLDMELIT